MSPPMAPNEKRLRAQQLLRDSPDGVVVGIDEAGRGPVLGPMVYAAAACAPSFVDQLRALGCNDSKMITAELREHVRAAVEDTGCVCVYERSLSADYLSRAMLRRCKYNLNAISHDTAASLVHEVMSSGARVTQLYVDTVGDAARYESTLREQFPHIRSVTVCSCADSRFAIVGAASIFAKTSRDAQLRRTTFALEPTLGPELGSGYPSDPVTLRWLCAAVDAHFGFPSLVRFSWGTARALLERHCVRVRFEADGADGGGGEDERRGAARQQKRRKAGGGGGADLRKLWSTSPSAGAAATKAGDPNAEVTSALHAFSKRHSLVFGAGIL